MTKLTARQKIELWIKKSSFNKNTSLNTQLLVHAALNIFKTENKDESLLVREDDKIFVASDTDRRRYILDHDGECFYTTSPIFIDDETRLEPLPREEYFIKSSNKRFFIQFETTFAKSIKKISRVRWELNNERAMRAEYIRLFELNNGQNIIFYHYTKDGRIFEGIDTLSPDGETSKKIEKLKKRRVTLGDLTVTQEYRDYIFKKFFDMGTRERLFIQTAEGSSLASGIKIKELL